MVAVQEGQCGLCAHFGETHDKHDKNAKLVQILSTHEAAEDIVDECGHPKHAVLHLKVTPVSGCDGFLPAIAA